ncbi:hypothetical protein ACFE04_016013 [Oxalis oulophora]
MAAETKKIPNNTPTTAITTGVKQKSEREESLTNNTSSSSSKRQKNCPKSLNVFTFDTKFNSSSSNCLCSSPDFTPKFGSFNSHKDRQCSHHRSMNNSTEDQA